MISRKSFDDYMLNQYGIARAEFSPSYDWMFLQRDARGRMQNQVGVIQARVFDQIMQISLSEQEAGNTVIEILSGRRSANMSVQPSAPEPMPWTGGVQPPPVMSVQHPAIPQEIFVDQYGNQILPYQVPQGAPQAPQGPVPQNPQGVFDPSLATPQEIAAMQQGQHIDAPMNQLLGDPNQMVPPMQDPSFNQAMQQANMPPQQLQYQPGMDVGPHVPQNPLPQVPQNLQPPAGINPDIFPIGESTNEEISLPGDAPF